jgi:acetoin:2,6-dichlorophenolindophenol oxidoreductase subunit alpha
MTPRTHQPDPAPPPPSESGCPLISDQKLAALYKAMLKHRMLERHMRAKSIRPIPRLCGRDAVASGIAINLLPEDQLRTADGSPIPGLIRQEPAAEDAIRTVFGQLGERAAQARSGAPWDEVLQIARALKFAATKNVVAFICGLTRAPTDVLHRAAAERLPILFVCRSKRERENLAAMADGCGLPGMVVDCEDAVAVYRVAAEALAHARRGNGPTLMECRQWPVERKQEKRSRGGNDSVHKMERYLAGKGLWTREIKRTTRAELERNLERALASLSNGAHG